MNQKNQVYFDYHSNDSNSNSNTQNTNSLYQDNDKEKQYIHYSSSSNINGQPFGVNYNYSGNMMNDQNYNLNNQMKSQNQIYSQDPQLSNYSFSSGNQENNNQKGYNSNFSSSTNINSPYRINQYSSSNFPDSINNLQSLENKKSAYLNRINLDNNSFPDGFNQSTNSNFEIINRNNNFNNNVDGNYNSNFLINQDNKNFDSKLSYNDQFAKNNIQEVFNSSVSQQKDLPFENSHIYQEFNKKTDNKNRDNKIEDNNNIQSMTIENFNEKNSKYNQLGQNISNFEKSNLSNKFEDDKNSYYNSRISNNSSYCKNGEDNSSNTPDNFNSIQTFNFEQKIQTNGDTKDLELISKPNKNVQFILTNEELVEEENDVEESIEILNLGKKKKKGGKKSKNKEHNSLIESYVFIQKLKKLQKSARRMLFKLHVRKFWIILFLSFRLKFAFRKFMKKIKTKQPNSSESSKKRNISVISFEISNEEISMSSEKIIIDNQIKINKNFQLSSNNSNENSMIFSNINNIDDKSLLKTDFINKQPPGQSVIIINSGNKSDSLNLNENNFVVNHSRSISESSLIINMNDSSQKESVNQTMDSVQKKIKKRKKKIPAGLTKQFSKILKIHINEMNDIKIKNRELNLKLENLANEKMIDRSNDKERATNVNENINKIINEKINYINDDNGNKKPKIKSYETPLNYQSTGIENYNTNLQTESNEYILTEGIQEPKEIKFDDNYVELNKNTNSKIEKVIIPNKLINKISKIQSFERGRELREKIYNENPINKKKLKTGGQPFPEGKGIEINTQKELKTLNKNYKKYDSPNKELNNDVYSKVISFNFDPKKERTDQFFSSKKNKRNGDHSYSSNKNFICHVAKEKPKYKRIFDSCGKPEPILKPVKEKIFDPMPIEVPNIGDELDERTRINKALPEIKSKNDSDKEFEEEEEFNIEKSPKIKNYKRINDNDKPQPILKQEKEEILESKPIEVKKIEDKNDDRTRINKALPEIKNKNDLDQEFEEEEEYEIEKSPKKLPIQPENMIAVDIESKNIPCDISTNRLRKNSNSKFVKVTIPDNIVKNICKIQSRERGRALREKIYDENPINKKKLIEPENLKETEIKIDPIKKIPESLKSPKNKKPQLFEEAQKPVPEDKLREIIPAPLNYKENAGKIIDLLDKVNKPINREMMKNKLKLIENLKKVPSPIKKNSDIYSKDLSFCCDPKKQISDKFLLSEKVLRNGDYRLTTNKNIVCHVAKDKNKYKRIFDKDGKPIPIIKPEKEKIYDPMPIENIKNEENIYNPDDGKKALPEEVQKDVPDKEYEEEYEIDKTPDSPDKGKKALPEEVQKDNPDEEFEEEYEINENPDKGKKTLPEEVQKDDPDKEYEDEYEIEKSPDQDKSIKKASNKIPNTIKGKSNQNQIKNLPDRSINQESENSNKKRDNVTTDKFMPRTSADQKGNLIKSADIENTIDNKFESSPDAPIIRIPKISNLRHSDFGFKIDGNQVGFELLGNEKPILNRFPREYSVDDGNKIMFDIFGEEHKIKKSDLNLKYSIDAYPISVEYFGKEKEIKKPSCKKILKNLLCPLLLKLFDQKTKPLKRELLDGMGKKGNSLRLLSALDNAGRTVPKQDFIERLRKIQAISKLKDLFNKCKEKNPDMETAEIKDFIKPKKILRFMKETNWMKPMEVEKNSPGGLGLSLGNEDNEGSLEILSPEQEKQRKKRKLMIITEYMNLMMNSDAKGFKIKLLDYLKMMAARSKLHDLFMKYRLMCLRNKYLLHLNEAGKKIRKTVALKGIGKRLRRKIMLGTIKKWLINGFNGNGAIAVGGSFSYQGFSICLSDYFKILDVLSSRLEKFMKYRERCRGFYKRHIIKYKIYADGYYDVYNYRGQVQDKYEF